MKSFKKKVVLGLAALALVLPFTNVKADGTVKYDIMSNSVESVCDDSDVCTTTFKITVKHDIEEGFAMSNGTKFQIAPKSTQIEKLTNVKVTFADGYTGENGETELELGSGLETYEFVIKSDEQIPANQVQTIATVSYSHAKDMDDCSVKLSAVVQQGEEEPTPIVVTPPTEEKPYWDIWFSNTENSNNNAH